MEKYISCTWKRKKKSWGSSTYIDKIDQKTKALVRDKEEQYIMIKGTIQQENITLVYMYAPNTGSPTYVRQILMNIMGIDGQKYSRNWGFLLPIDFIGYIFQTENQGNSSLK